MFFLKKNKKKLTYIKKKQKKLIKNKLIFFIQKKNLKLGLFKNNFSFKNLFKNYQNYLLNFKKIKLKIILKYIHFFNKYIFFFNIIEKKNNIFFNIMSNNFFNLKNTYKILFTKTIKSLKKNLKIKKKRQKFKNKFIFKFIKFFLIKFYKFFFYEHLIKRIKKNFITNYENITSINKYKNKYNKNKIKESLNQNNQNLNFDYYFDLKNIRFIIKINYKKKKFIKKIFRILKKLKEIKYIKIFFILSQRKIAHNGCRLKSIRRL